MEGRKKPFDLWVGEVLARESPETGLSLDLGSGPARYHRYYRNRVVGIDLRQEASPTLVADLTHLPYKDGCFLFVTAFQCIYYLNDVEAALREMLRVLCPGGNALVSVSSPVHLWHDQLRYRGIPQRHGYRGWSRMFQKAGWLSTPLEMPSRYCVQSKLRVSMRSWLSPYRFYRLERA